MTEQKQSHEGSCCKSESKCCGCKKFFMGILFGILIAIAAHCFLCGHGGNCGKSQVCPLTHMMAPAATQ